MATRQSFTIYRFDSPCGEYCYIGTTVNLDKRIAGHRSKGPLFRHLAGHNQENAKRHFRKVDTVSRKEQALEQKNELIRQAFIEAYENRNKPLPLNQTIPGIEKAISMKMVDRYLEDRPEARKHLKRAFNRPSGKRKDYRERITEGQVPTFARLLADQNEASALRAKKKANAKKKNNASEGWGRFLILAVLLIAVIAVFGPGFFGRARGISPQHTTARTLSTGAPPRVTVSDDVRQILARHTATARARQTASRPTRTPRLTRETKTRYVTNDSVSVIVRSRPDRDGAIIGSLLRGSEVTVLGEIRGERIGNSDSWSHIMWDGENTDAFVFSPLLGPHPPPLFDPDATADPVLLSAQIAAIQTSAVRSQQVTHRNFATHRATRAPLATRTPRSSPVTQTYYVISGRAFVYARSCPSTTCSVLREPVRGSKVAVLEEVQGENVKGSTSWWRVDLPGDAREAYIHGPLLGPNPPPPLVPTATPPPTRAPAQAPPTDTPQPQPQPVQQQPAAPAGEQARVVWITDGDSIEVEMNGQRFRVRYIGINTPERREPCSDAAKDANARLVSGRTVTLVRDVSNTDRYDRLLRYIYVGNTFVNEVLVRDGYAENSVWSPDTRYANHFRALEAEARAAGRGCHPTGVYNDGNTER